MDIFKTLQMLSQLSAPSGAETSAAEAIAELWRPLTDGIQTDRIGNLIAIKRGTGGGPSLMLAAHMDEIGLMVNRLIDHNGYGFLGFTRVGGVDIRHLYSQTVIVHGEKELIGIIGALPTSMLPEHKNINAYSLEDLIIDTGLPFAELETLVEVGAFVSFEQKLRKLGSGRATGKALDNRASVAAVTACLNELQKREHSGDIIAVATVQEETRLLGARIGAYHLEPDLAIAIDVTFAKGGGVSDNGTFELGGGPAIGFGTNVHPFLFKEIKKAAGRIEMKTNLEPHAAYSGTDAMAIHLTRGGVPTGLISIPIRYMHTMVETVALKDIERSGRLMAEFAAGLDENFLSQLEDELMDGPTNSKDVAE